MIHPTQNPDLKRKKTRVKHDQQRRGLGLHRKILKRRGDIPAMLLGNSSVAMVDEPRRSEISWPKKGTAVPLSYHVSLIVGYLAYFATQMINISKIVQV